MKSVRVTMDGYVSQEHVVDVRDNRPAVRLQVTLTRGADD